VSLIPYTYHAQVIQAAIKHKKHVVTTSYVNDAMAALDQQARDAGITVMNEVAQAASQTKVDASDWIGPRNRSFVRSQDH
jgi:saccharopine dehydrogenase (NADP+, L-glutamate forming)